MGFKQAIKVADKTLTSDATLDELREAADNLRALTPDSALADLVEKKIEEILREDGPSRRRPKLKANP